VPRTTPIRTPAPTPRRSSPAARPGGLALLLVLLAACGGDPAPTATSTAIAVTTTTTTPPTTAPATTTSTTTTTSTSTTTTTTPTTTTTEAPDLEALARSVLMIGMPGKGLDDITAAHLAGGGRAIILMGRNVYDPGQVTSLTNDVACAAADPVLIAADQELGLVARLRGLVTPLPSAREAQALTSIELELTGQLLGNEMLELGVNMDLAPILDVVRGPNPVLVDRHLGDDPDLVAELGTAFMRGLRQAKVVAVPKHFPGHGLSTTDPHGGVTTITATAEELAEVDFIPFMAAVADGAGAIMVGHPIYAALDPDLPASLSPAVLALLRDHFGFEGVAVTDSLTMQAVSAGRSAADVAVAALAAGEDLLLVVDAYPVEEMVAGIVAAVNSGDLPLQRLQEASARVSALAEMAGRVVCRA